MLIFWNCLEGDLATQWTLLGSWSKRRVWFPLWTENDFFHFLLNFSHIFWIWINHLNIFKDSFQVYFFCMRHMCIYLPAVNAPPLENQKRLKRGILGKCMSFSLGALLLGWRSASRQLPGGFRSRPPASRSSSTTPSAAIYLSAAWQIIRGSVLQACFCKLAWGVTTEGLYLFFE